MQRHPLIISLLTANLGVLLATAFLSNGNYLGTFIYSAVYANCLASLAGFFVPKATRAAASSGRNVPATVALSGLLSVAIGGLLAQLILTLIHRSAPAQFWSKYFDALKTTSVLGLVFGMGAFYYGSIREQLRQTAEGKQLAEERARKLEVEARLASFQARLNPHFLFNALNSVTALIPVDAVRAEEMLVRLSHLLRKILDSAQSSLVSIEDELAMSEEYLAIEGMRLGDRLQIQVKSNPAIHGCLVPPLSIQCLAENAIKHGISPQLSGGNIEIVAERLDGLLRIRVSDDGPGFDLTQLHPGHGLDILLQRLQAIFGDRAKFDVVSSRNGCTAELLIPQP